jgi:hypothetical protein
LIIGECVIIDKRGGVVTAVNGDAVTVRMKEDSDYTNPTAFGGESVDVKQESVTSGFEYECPESSSRRKFYGIPNLFYRGNRYYSRIIQKEFSIDVRYGNCVETPTRKGKSALWCYDVSFSPTSSRSQVTLIVYDPVIDDLASVTLSKGLNLTPEERKSTPASPWQDLPLIFDFKK